MLKDQYSAMRRKEPSERERLLEAALDQVPYGVQIYDQDAHIVFFNRVRLTCKAFSSMYSVVPHSAKQSCSVVTRASPLAKRATNSFP